MWWRVDMKYNIYDNVIVLHIDKGEEVLSSIKKLCNMENITAGLVSGLGNVDRIVIGLYKVKDKKYYSSEFNGDFEITNLTGNISVMNNEPYLHIHGTFSNIQGDVIGGHLNEARISGAGEIIIQRISGEIKRRFNEEIGSNLIDFNE